MIQDDVTDAQNDIDMGPDYNSILRYCRIETSVLVRTGDEEGLRRSIDDFGILGEKSLPLDGSDATSENDAVGFIENVQEHEKEAILESNTIKD